MGKKRGRKRKALPDSDYEHRRRHGMFPNQSSNPRQLEGIIRAQGTLSRSALLSARSLTRLCLRPHPRNVSLKGDGAAAYAIMGTAGEPVLRSLVAQLSGRSLYSPDDEASPWLLTTCGTCVPHVDLAQPMVFTLLICVDTEAPYQMRIGANKKFVATRMREVTLTCGSYMIFPSAVSHECVAAENNKRTIINVLIK